ncbi:phenoloxidase-activating enzyme 1-like [Battus philenor]|uniref:phenoloxidase-activating enzyme 1-like n=1 Tax=Battus philenor TaxID=42288 RepID=UPI0035D125F8
MKYCIVVFCFSFLWSYVVSESCTTPLGATSVCVSLYDCKQLLSAFEERPLRNDVVSFLRQSQCGFQGYVPRVCCGPLPSQRPSTTLPPPPQTTKPLVEGVVDSVVPEDSFPTPQDKCGIDTNGDRIFGGQFTDLDEFPWMVLQGYLTKANKMTYQCGGVLLNHRYELTAAHCVVGEIETAVGKLKSVRLGEYDIQTEIDCIDGECADPYQEIAVLSAHPHPGFVDGKVNREDDIALVRLAQRAKYTFFVKPICLPETSLRLSEGSDVFVAGWGKTLRGNRSPVKLKLGMPIFNRAQCFQKYKKVGADLTEKQICAGGAFAEDACRGDSGGPLMRRRPNGVWETVAVVSFGYGCGREGWPGVYTSIASYLDWIKNTMRATNV